MDLRKKRKMTSQERGEFKKLKFSDNPEGWHPIINLQQPSANGLGESSSSFRVDLSPETLRHPPPETRRVTPGVRPSPSTHHNNNNNNNNNSNNNDQCVGLGESSSSFRVDLPPETLRYPPPETRRPTPRVGPSPSTHRNNNNNDPCVASTSGVLSYNLIGQPLVSDEPSSLPVYNSTAFQFGDRTEITFGGFDTEAQPPPSLELPSLPESLLDPTPPLTSSGQIDDLLSKFIHIFPNKRIVYGVNSLPERLYLSKSKLVSMFYQEIENSFYAIIRGGVQRNLAPEIWIVFDSSKPSIFEVGKQKLSVLLGYDRETIQIRKKGISRSEDSDFFHIIFNILIKFIRGDELRSVFTNVAKTRFETILNIWEKWALKHV